MKLKKTQILQTDIMQTIRLKVNDKIYKQLMWFLDRFNKEEIQVINESSEFISVQEYLKKELDKVEDGSAEYISIDQLDDSLEATIKKYEA
jgi:hypothetical protein